jgi:capsular exopolysaccharide synthesis family protein
MSELQPIPREPAGAVATRVPHTIDTTAVSIEVPRGTIKNDYGGLLEYWQMVRRNKGAVILAVFIGGLLGFLVTLSSPRVYQATTTLEIRGLNEDFLNMGKVNPVAENSPYFDTDLQTQVKVLQSRTLGERVIKKLEGRPRPRDLQPPDRLGMWRTALKINPPDAATLWRQALATASGGLRVRSSGTNRIVEVSCDSTYAPLAANFCNTLAQEYIDQSLEARWKSTEYTGEWLTQQLQDLKIKLEKQEEELQAYTHATGLLITGEKNDVREAQLDDLQKELSVARADRIGKQSKFEMASSSAPEALPDVLDDASLRTAQASLSELQARLAQLRITFTSNHPEVRRLEAQIDSVQSSLVRARSNILTRIGNEFAAAQRREALLDGAYKRQAETVAGKAEELARYSLLKRDVDATRMLYDTLQQRLKEASIAAALRASNVRIVDTADVPGGPYKPNVSQRLIVGVLFGLMFGVAFAVFRERADRTLQDPGDSTYYLGLNELGVLPVAEFHEGPRPRRRSPSAALLLKDTASKEKALDGRVELTSWRQKQSLLAESIRSTLTSVLFSYRNGERPHVLVLTSGSPKEGKTTTVSNLAIAMAEINQRVLIVDADMRRPRLHTVFGLHNGIGLSDLLAEKRPLEAPQLLSACAPTPVAGLFMLTSGNSRAHASTLLHTQRLPEMIRLARDSFDMVIIDTPPMINIADSRVIARFADALVLVVRSGVTTRDAALMAKARFADDGIPILGTILNFWNPSTPGYHYYKYYYSGYNAYYGNGNGKGSGGADDDGSSVDDTPSEDSAWKPGLSMKPSFGDHQVTRESET